MINKSLQEKARNHISLKELSDLQNIIITKYYATISKNEVELHVLTQANPSTR